MADMEQFKTNILAIYGAVGEHWLDSLPKLLAQHGNGT